MCRYTRFRFLKERDKFYLQEFDIKLENPEYILVKS